MSAYGWIINKKKVAERPTFPHYQKWIDEEAKKHHLKIDILFIEDISIQFLNGKGYVFVNGERVTLPDFVLFRAYDLHLVRFLEAENILTFNTAESQELSLNKWRAHQTLSRCQIPQPQSMYYCSVDQSNFDQLKQSLGIPFIAKESSGAQGKEVYLVENETDFLSIRESARITGKELFFQEFIKSSFGRDVRVYVVGDKILGSVLRTSDIDFRSNISLGASATPIDLDEQTKDMVLKVTRIIGLSIAGVDLLFGEEGFIFNEINANPAISSLLKTDVNFYGEIFQFITSKLCLKQPV
ncbi:MAG: RimK family alpha-L-glutamate ligase [Bacillus sp. (in: firmicutes)]